MPLGSEPAARAGARVASVSTPHALWYNPAGLAYSKRQLLFDLNLPIVRSSYTRFMNGASSPTLDVNSAVLPIPTLAYSDDFGLERFGFGVGVIVPPAYALDWPSSVDGQPAPQRYSILNADGSAIASLVLAAAYRPLERLSLGIAVYLTTAQVAGEVAISACEYAICSQPEGREWTGRSKFQLGPEFAASATFGARYDFDRVRVGASVQLRTKISGEADFDVLLPDQAIFDEVTLTNAQGGRDLKADMEFILPTIVRAGVEVDIYEPLSVELAGTWENWASQSTIEVRPKGVRANDVPGVGTVVTQPVSLARNIRDTWAVHLGGTHDLTQYMHKGRKLAVNAGFMFETSSFAPRDLSPITIDTNKALVSIGASVELVRNLLLDVSYGHMFMKNRTVRNSRVRLPAAIRPEPTDPDPNMYEVGEQPIIGNGRYEIEADFVAVGVRWMIDRPATSD
jgi:long-chain fatty acid transport protein